jgi:predicted GIY-YIG superfamily endonuclease
MGTVYLIHFEQPLKHAHHYLGWCNDGKLKERLERHRAGNGSKLMRAIKLAGIGWQVVRTWENVDRSFERKLKNHKKTQKFCPVCCGSKPPKDIKTEQFTPTESQPF